METIERCALGYHIGCLSTISFSMHQICGVEESASKHGKGWSRGLNADRLAFVPYHSHRNPNKSSRRLHVHLQYDQLTSSHQSHRTLGLPQLFSRPHHTSLRAPFNYNSAQHGHHIVHAGLQNAGADSSATVSAQQFPSLPPTPDPQFRSPPTMVSKEPNIISAAKRTLPFLSH